MSIDPARELATPEKAKERRQADEALEPLRAQFETLVNEAPLGIYVVDNALRIRDVNSKARPLFGDLPDLIGRDFEEVMHILWHPAYAEELVARFRHTLETGEPYFAAQRIEERRDRGVREYYEWQANRIPLPEGGYGVVCYFREIEAQVLAQAAIVESEDRFRALVTASSDVVYRMSPDWSEMRQLQGREFIADTLEPSCTWLDKYIHPDDQGRVMAAINEAIRTQSVFELEHRVLRVDGTLGWTFSRAIPIIDEHGEVLEWCGMASDVTRRKEAEAALSRQRRLYEAILANTPDLAYIFDLNHRFIYANEGLLQMWGKSWEEAIGKNCLELGYEPWHAAMHDQEIEQVVATKQPVRGEVPFTGTYGRRIYDYIFVPVLGADGQVEAVAGTTRDVTDYRRTEEALQEADRRKDEFLAMLAHELRNPLGPIRNALHLLRLQGGDPERVDYLREMMERQTAHISRLMDDLLDVSRISRGKISLREERLDLVRLVAATTEHRQPSQDAAGLSLQLDLLDTPVWVLGDPTRLRQVLDNLLDNAEKFTDRGGKVIVSLSVDPPTKLVRLSIKDTGMGIDPAMLPHLFDVFSQGDRTLDRSRGGLGLGLALVKGLVELHRGRVEASSEGVGQGAEFRVFLPLEPETAALAPSRPGVGPCADGLRVLVVEDNPDAAESLRLLLDAYGCEVVVAASGPAGLEAAKTTRPDIIVCDVGLPGMDGYEVARALRQEQETGHPRLIALTGYGQEEDIRRAKEAGFDLHLTKPADPEKLLAELQPDKLTVEIEPGV